MARNRIVEVIEDYRVGDLVHNEKNWRIHSPGQKIAMESSLERIGKIDALRARRLPDGRLQLVDGHMRADLDPEDTYTVIVLDLDDEETDYALATFDPLGTMATTDPEKLMALINSIPPLDPLLDGHLRDMIDDSPMDFNADALNTQGDGDVSGMETSFRVTCEPDDKDSMHEALEEVVAKFAGATLT